MNDEEIYDELYYMPEELGKETEYKIDNTGNKTNDYIKQKINPIETPTNEDYGDFDDINIAEIQENYEDPTEQEINALKDNLFSNHSKKSNFNLKNKFNEENEDDFNINNGNLDNYLDDVIRKNEINEESILKGINQIGSKYTADLHNSNNSKHPIKKNIQKSHKVIQENSSYLKNPPVDTQKFQEMPSMPKDKHENLKLNNVNIMSRMQIAEREYREVKEKLDKITEFREINPENNQSVELLANENLKLIKYLEKISGILDIVVQSSKIPLKSKTKSTSHFNIAKPSYSKSKFPTKNLNSNSGTNNPNNNKLIEVYKKEYEKLLKRFNQISDPNYSEDLEQTLFELDAQLNYFDQENRNLKNRQKQSEFFFERQYKNNSNPNSNFDEESKRINQEYENIKRLNQITFEKAQKNMNALKENEEKLKTLSEHNQMLQIIAKDMYKIDNLDEFLEQEKNEQKLNERRQVLKKKIDILEKVLVNNKKKYEAEIARNEKNIMNLENNKLELMKILREKSALAFTTAGYAKGIYESKDLIGNIENRIIENEKKAQEMLEKFLNEKHSEKLDLVNNYNEINPTKNDLYDQSTILNNTDYNLVNNSSKIKKPNGDTEKNNDLSNMNNRNNLYANQSIENKKEILKEVDKKATEINSSLISANNNIIICNSNKSELNSNIDNNEENKYIGKNNKPNFKFNFSQHSQNNVPTLVRQEKENAKPLYNNKNITEEEINSQENTYKIKLVEDKKIQLEANRNSESNNETDPPTNNLERVISEKDPLSLKEPSFNKNNSRRLNNLSQFKTNDKPSDQGILNNSNLNDNNQFFSNKQTEIPSFLKDFKEKEQNLDKNNGDINNMNETNTNNSIISNAHIKNLNNKLENFTNNTENSNILGDLPQRRNRNTNTYKTEKKSVFEEVLNHNLYEEKADNIKKIEQPSFLQEFKPNDKAEKIGEDPFYRKRREEFDQLFKEEEEEPVEEKRIEIKPNTNNMMFSRNRDHELSIQSKNVEDSFKQDKKIKPKTNILDELEEIDLL